MSEIEISSVPQLSDRLSYPGSLQAEGDC